MQDYRKGRDQSPDGSCRIKQELVRGVGQIGREVWRLNIAFQYVTCQYYYYFFNFDLFTVLSYFYTNFSALLKTCLVLSQGNNLVIDCTFNPEYLDSYFILVLSLWKMMDALLLLMLTVWYVNSSVCTCTS